MHASLDPKIPSMPYEWFLLLTHLDKNLTILELCFQIGFGSKLSYPFIAMESSHNSDRWTNLRVICSAPPSR